MLPIRALNTMIIVYRSDIVAVNMPMYVHILNGAVEKLNMPSNA